MSANFDLRLEKSPNNNLLLTVGFPTMFYSINIDTVSAVIYLVKDSVLPHTHPPTRSRPTRKFNDAIWTWITCQLTQHSIYTPDSFSWQSPKFSFSTTF